MNNTNWNKQITSLNKIKTSLNDKRTCFSLEVFERFITKYAIGFVFKESLSDNVFSIQDPFNLPFLENGSNKKSFKINP